MGELHLQIFQDPVLTPWVHFLNRTSVQEEEEDCGKGVALTEGGEVIQGAFGPDLCRVVISVA